MGEYGMRLAILYGVPSGHIWHEVFEAIRFFAIITLVLLGVTASRDGMDGAEGLIADL